MRHITSTQVWNVANLTIKCKQCQHPAILIVGLHCYVKLLSHKIFDARFPLGRKYKKISKLLKASEKIMKFCSEIREMLWNFRMRNL